jgi:hypothetical protein
MKAQFLYKSQGYLANMLEVTPIKPTKRWLLMFLGTGELGPADGSQIGELDNYGYQRNILVPQAVTSYGEFEFKIINDMISRYGEDIEIVLTGHSLGARQVIEYITKYQGNTVPPQVKGFMPIAGAISGSTPIWSNCYDLPVMGVHGDKDTSISYYQTKKLIDGLNTWVDRKNKAIFKLVPGCTHGSIMSEVFKYDKQSEYYQFIMNCFSPEEDITYCQAELDRTNMKATFYLDGGVTETYNLS